MKFSEYAAHAVECGATPSYVLEPDLTDRQLQTMERTFISFHHAPLILTAYAAGMSVAPGETEPTSSPQMSPRPAFTDEHLFAAPLLNMSPTSRCSLPNREISCRALICCLKHGFTDNQLTTVPGTERCLDSGLHRQAGEFRDRH